jgi:hypothetical protein
MGAAVDGALKEKLCVTVIAARENTAPTGVSMRTETHTTGAASGAREVVMARLSQKRKGNARPVQTQLPLTIVSKGRFDKSEPTKHNGEDLDVPTFLRRGVPLN